MQTRCPRQAIILQQQQLLILVHPGARYGRMINFFPKVIRLDPLAPIQTLAQGVLCKLKCSFLSVTSWIWTVAAKRLFSHFLKYMIYFFAPWFYCYRHTCYFDGRCQIAKSNRWTCIFLLRVAINKELPVSTQSFASFAHKRKHGKAERYELLPKNRSGFGAKM